MINDIILFAKLAETNLASYGSRLRGMCEGQKINTVIELLRLYYTGSISDTIPYCGWTMKATFEMFCSDILNMTDDELQEMTQQILSLRRGNPLRRSYIIPRKISIWLEGIYQEFILDYPSFRIREKFLAMYHNVDRFYQTLLFHPENAFCTDIDPDWEVVKEIWQFTIYVAKFLTDSVLKNRALPKTDSFRKKCEEFVENLHICHLEAYNRLNYLIAGRRGQRLVQDAYNRKVNALEDVLRQLLATPESMARITFGHPELVWKGFESLTAKTRSTLKTEFEDLYTLLADLAHHSPKENDKQYLDKMFDFLEPYQQDRVMEYIRANDNTPILYLILAYVRSRPTGSYMDVLARFNGFFSSEQTIEQIASSLGARRNRIVALFQKPEPDKTLSRIASYPEAKRYNLTQNDWIDLTEPMTLLDDDEKALVEKLNASNEALYYALSTLCQVEMVPMLDRMIGIAPELVEEMDFPSAITYLWKTKFKYSESPRTLSIPEIVSLNLKIPQSHVRDMGRIERVFIGLVRLIMPDLQLGYPNIIIQPSKVNAEAELFRFISLMKEITLESIYDIFTSNYPQFNIRHPEALIPVIELSGGIGYNTRKRKFMPRGPKTVKYPYNHVKDPVIEDRSWIKYQDINGVDEPQTEMPSQGTKGLTFEQITQAQPESPVKKTAPIIKETTDIKSALQAALAITAKLTDVDSIETSAEYSSLSEDEEPEMSGLFGISEATPKVEVPKDRMVTFDTEDLDIGTHGTPSGESANVDIEESIGTESESLESDSSEEQLVAVTPHQTKEVNEPDTVDILEDFTSGTELEQPTDTDREQPSNTEQDKNLGPIADADVDAEVEDEAEVEVTGENLEPIKETIIEEVTETLQEEPLLPAAESNDDEEVAVVPEVEVATEKLQPITKPVSEEVSEETIEEREQTAKETPIATGEIIEEIINESVKEQPQEVEEPADVKAEELEPTDNELPSQNPEEEIVESVVEEPQSKTEEQVGLTTEQHQVDESEKPEAKESAQPESVGSDHPATQEVPAVNPKEETEIAADEVPAFVTETTRVVPEPITIVAEEAVSKPSALGRLGRSKKTPKEIVVVKEPQAEMSPYRQSKVLEDKKAEEEKEKKTVKGKRGRKPLPKPEPSLPLKENILILLRNSKAPMTVSNIEKSLRKAGVEPTENEVADIIYHSDKDEFLFFQMNFVGLMDKKYNFSVYRLDPNSYQTFDYMGRAFFAFCDQHGRMPFRDEDEERFLDRWVGHLLDEKVKCTRQQMKWFRQEVIKRRGKVMNKEEWTFVDNCRKYKEFYDEHKAHPNTLTAPRLSKWFGRARENYESLNMIKRNAFDELVQYLDQFGLFGIFD